MRLRYVCQAQGAKKIKGKEKEVLQELAGEKPGNPPHPHLDAGGAEGSKLGNKGARANGSKQEQGRKKGSSKGEAGVDVDDAGKHGQGSAVKGEGKQRKATAKSHGTKATPTKTVAATADHDDDNDASTPATGASKVCACASVMPMRVLTVLQLATTAPRLLWGVPVRHAEGACRCKNTCCAQSCGRS